MGNTKNRIRGTLENLQDCKYSIDILFDELLDEISSLEDKVIDLEEELEEANKMIKDYENK